jgi:YVTN family beta-propeller protein
MPVGGDGGWDYLTVDTAGHRLFVTRSDRVMVIDPRSGRVLGEIPGLKRGHGVAFAYETGHGFATSGADSSVTMFDLKSLAVLAKGTAAVDADAVLYDPATQHIFTFNGDAGSSSVIDASTGQRIGSIPLGGKPEFGVSAGDGKLYANIEDSSQVVEIDARAMRVTRRWPIAPCESPTGLALDRAHHRLFSVCRNKLMAISDAVAGTLVTTVPIGGGVDAAAYDASTGNAFASNGEGSLTVVHEDAPDRYRVVATVPTMAGARTMALDPQTHHVFTVSAKFGPQPAAATPDNPRRRPPVIPGSFTVIEVEP